MSNPIYDMLGGAPQINDTMQLINQFMQFRNNFTGNAVK